ncbi:MULTISPECIES: urate hydroxylase PuuD [unclassified Massilia]|uniref:urate hydroxylase PuuD n=1 Tax=unclassified Massilia TaxID=2609279 RepID=UPI0017815563|nr:MULTISPECIES: urate hydroxylase PuuD [unclassified Massilia]MBD8529084.1 urate hydroxylase PuuD [Massilia sp. CFBP 13647]MBD8672478.1 urate hydroxylase PuuD [Massilia sp. CFBP 13721]
MDVFGHLAPYGLEWLNLLVRWLHIITGIAWIGASFYFVWLDNTIRPPAPGSDLAQKGVAGELWAVHGGGFYNPQKYLVAPAELPKELHWFKWEAYSTWLSGFALLFIVYYLNAQAMMVDRSVADLSSGQAVGIGLGSLVVSWLVYDLLCKSPLGKHDLAFGAVIFVFLVAASYVLTHLLSGRAAYLHIGAMIGTIMVANVAHVIIPGQRKMVNAMMAGQKPDPVYGIRAKQRSVHNNYFTLPVLFLMISNHYAMTYRHEHAWAVLAVIMAAGVLIRHFFNLRHKGRIEWKYPAAGVALLAVLAVLIAPRAPLAQQPGVDVAAQFTQVKTIVDQRCVSCHAATPTQPGFAAAPAGVMLDSPELVAQHAARIYQQTVQLKAMPLANLTHMTDAERAQVGAWFEAGAKTGK